MSTTPRQSQSLERLPALFPSGWRWWLMMGVLSAIMALGAWSYLRQCEHGLVDTGMRSVGSGGATWGLAVAFYIYFVGVSFSDIVIALLIRLFNIESLKPLGRLSELLTMVALSIGGLAILTDQGRVVHSLFNIAAYGRLASPFFGTFSSITGGYFFASLVFFYLASRPDASVCARYRPRWRWAYNLIAMGFQGRKAEFARHHRVSFWMALIIMLLLVVEQSTLGFVFGIQAGRPGWYSALKAPGFLVLAGASGIGMLMLVALFLRRYLNLYKVIPERAFFWLSNFMWIMVLIYLYFMGVEQLTSNYAAPAATQAVSQALVSGSYAWVFWITLAMFVIPFAILFTQFLRRKVWIPGIVISSVLINLAVMFERVMLVVPSQTHGMLLPYQNGIYIPSWDEYSMIAALFALGLFCILIYIRLFPIVPVLEEPTHEDGHAAPELTAPSERPALRISLFGLTLLAGLALVTVGLLASFRVGTKPAADPIIPYAPAIFILGMGVTLASAVVYEISPAARPKAVLPAPAGIALPAVPPVLPLTATPYAPPAPSASPAPSAPSAPNVPPAPPPGSPGPASGP